MINVLVRYLRNPYLGILMPSLNILGNISCA